MNLNKSGHPSNQDNSIVAAILITINLSLSLSSLFQSGHHTIK